MTAPVPDPEEWDFQLLTLGQSLLGAVSPNFRMVVLDRDDRAWVLRFFLQAEDEGNREEIVDIAMQFDAYQSGHIEHRVEVVVTDAPMRLPSRPARVVYWRRDYCER